LILKMLEVIDKYFGWIERKILITIPLLLTILTIFAVINRFIFRYSMSWYEEIAIFFYMIIVYWGSSRVSKDDGHFTVDFLKEKLEGKALFYSEIIIYAVCLLIALLGLYFGIKMSLIVTMKTVSLKIPKSIIIFTTLTLGFFGMSLRYLCKILEKLKEYNKKAGN